ncbi:hypothetical protein ACFQ1E_06515 [Sphingomonas canadensis]|uniref:ESAT-6 protein secretion system EspG family protein n=1 Tax=Sphingomonas canadensis TaxID=1219257 RepID=A0ABW3H3E0_9SPHN|nr:hypothetical protein [Sphingomonas canadensis]MCW3835557.1 hypothetical protein [Sphingomonas canadensis]
MISGYDWPGGREAMLRFGPSEGPVVVAALPLFEEANRTRAFAVTLLRLLAGHGIGGALPDLPGTNESLVPTEEATLGRMREAFASATLAFEWEGRSCYVAAIRSGALIDARAEPDGRWYLSPQPGPDLLRELTRIAQAGAREGGTAFDPAALTDAAGPVEIAGNRIAPALLRELAAAQPADGPRVRTVRLETDARPADRKIDASPLWRRAEPDNDPALAALLAADIADWVRACEG